MPADRLRRLLFSLVAAWCMVPALHAGTPRDVTAVGRGASRDEAIVDALLAGARQIPALGTNDLAGLRPVFAAWLREEARLPVDRAGYKRRLPPAIDAAAGLVSDYEVLAVVREGAGRWRAELRIALADPVSRAATGDRPVGIFLLPFSLHAEDEAETGGMEALAAAQRERAGIDRLRELAGAALGGQRIALKAATPEQLADPRLALAFDNPSAVPWRDLAVPGTDYVVAVDVEDYLLEYHPANQRKKEPAYWRARFVLAWRVVSAPGTVVVASGRLRLDRADPELHVATKADVAGHDAAVAVPRILDVAARRLARQVEERLVPVQVLSTRDGMVALDRGAVTLAPGDVLAVLGAGLVEREEGAELPVALDGPRVAILETVSVEGTRATARVVRGRAATLLPGATVRRLAELPVPRMP